MKIKNRICIILVSLAMLLLMPSVAFAALPPSAEIQWTNTKAVGCNILISGTSGSIAANIIGNSGTTVRATVEFYMIKNGVRTTLYMASTPSNHSLSFAAFTCDFTPESGATYYLNLNGVVSKNGIDERISDSDIETVP